MKQLIAAVVAVFSVLFTAGCVASPPSAPIVHRTPAAQIDRLDPFEPDTSKCQSDLWPLGDQVDNLNMCIRSISTEMSRRSGLFTVDGPGALAMSPIPDSKCEPNLTAVHDDDLGSCFDSAMERMDTVHRDKQTEPVATDQQACMTDLTQYKDVNMMVGLDNCVRNVIGEVNWRGGHIRLYDPFGLGRTHAGFASSACQENLKGLNDANLANCFIYAMAWMQLVDTQTQNLIP
ncbi:MAG: hypothetical protein JWO07_217 [Candidatus Saccharibacteria bacterium]|nr:hypothetical protein [Candidatus Saccharibacteria bacterium]